jgi:phospholipase C
VPLGAKPGATSRFDCFKNTYFTPQLAQNNVPKFNALLLNNNHTVGTSPGQRTPRAMIAENDYALGQMVDLISHSPIWPKSLILVIEDDSQDGADHVDAHRIPALVISPYAKKNAVVHTRYDFLSFIRTLEITLGMDPLNLFDAVAVPLYDAFDATPNNSEPYDVIVPEVNLTERNTAGSPGAALSQKLPWTGVDRVPQRVLDRILWQSGHGAGSEPPPPGPNASGLDEAAWKAAGKPHE